MPSKIIVLGSSGGISANIAANSGPPRPTNIQTANANTTVAHNFTAGTLPTRYMISSSINGNMPISNSTSTNGVTWTTPATLSGVEVINFATGFNKTTSAHSRATAGNLDRIVIGGGDTGPTTARSKGAISYNEGRNFYPITFPNDNPITTVAWGKTGPGNSLFMGSAWWEFGQGSYIYTSPDGVNWTKVNNSIANATSERRVGPIMWDGKRWVLACYSGNATNYSEFGYSYDDGVTWTFNTIASGLSGGSIPNSMTFGKGKYLVGHQYGSLYSSSDDGNTWSLEITMGAEIRNLKYFSGANGGVFICCIEAKNVYYSFDATTWTSMSTTNITTGPIIDVEFGGNHFVALEQDSSGYSNTYTIPSVTSASWTKRLTGGQRYLDTLLKHRNTTVVNQGINSVSGNVWLTHADVRNGWQRITRTSPARIFQSQQWHNYRNECFLVPVYNTGGGVWTNTSFMITTTGVVNVNSYWVTLDAGTAAATNNFDTAGLMTIVVTGDGRIYRNSSNVFSDVDWTLSLNDGTSQAFNDVKYIPRFKKWIAVGTDKIYTSPDGINWQRRQYDFSGNAHKIEDNGYRTVILVEISGAVWVTLDGNYFKGYTSAQTGLTTNYDDRIMYSPRHSQFITDIANFSPDGLPTPWTSAGITRTKAGGIGETRNAIFIGFEVSGGGPGIMCNITTGANGSSDLLDSGYRTVPFVSPTGGILVSGASGFLP